MEKSSEVSSPEGWDNFRLEDLKILKTVGTGKTFGALKEINVYIGIHSRFFCVS